MPQTATTGNLENAQRIIIAAVRYTEEHNAPAMSLIEHMILNPGEKQVTVPKVRQSRPNVFRRMGRQLGDGMAGKKDTDVHALYSSVNGGTLLGIANAKFN